MLWHRDSAIPNDIDAVILPGGFSYGDYLRCGAIAKFSPLIGAVKSFAARGGLVIGICATGRQAPKRTAMHVCR